MSMLSELPAAPTGRSGWPWTEASPALPGTLSSGRPWPRLTIVTPSYNQGAFIEETIRSVLLQGYPNLEYFVVDGRSTDGSVGIIRKYARWLSGWTSEPDRGQAHAINKAFLGATGDLIAWINSDDAYLPAAFSAVAARHLEHRGALILGNVENFHEDTHAVTLVRQANVSPRALLRPETERCTWHQPGIFVPRTLAGSVGPLDETLHYSFDYDWLLRLTARAPVVYLDQTVARFRIHSSAKTTAHLPRCAEENRVVIGRHAAALSLRERRRERSLQHVREASIYLGHHPAYAAFWNRRGALRQLALAGSQWPPTMLLPHFLRLLRRAVLPRALLRSGPWS
jgi:glycosyltransferase involved in cell wall biosynthesis